ncbi:GNAT family N-acetyltransferase [Actinomadura latina]|uniref:GNAT family N-acetyltransferase n=1 Tax=Actinomadura latina TaxID=163603 RepID=A0A846Z550_9ACTN|nr:GNAT family N-acetyltransferase [Actinomadura latina]NKZ05346.1 GNAT family N-acetyltransferase [Actinomadura latina]
MVEIAIRYGRNDEMQTVLDFWKLAGEGTDRHDSSQGFLALIDRDPQALLVAEIDGRMVGTLIAGWDGWRAHLYRLAVHPEYRRQGIARKLTERAELRFRELGAFRADAMVLDENTLAHHAWSAAGYHRQPQWSRWVKPLG